MEESRMNKLRLAIVGGGHLGTIHTRIALQQPEVDLTAVVEVAPALQEKIRTEFGVRVVSDYNELIGNIDAVIVATPTTTHSDIAKVFLTAGIPTFVEKPITATYEEAARLVNIANSAGVAFQVGHVERFNPALTAAKQVVSDPKYIVSERCSGYPGRSLDVGVVLDLMIHDIDVILSLVRSNVKSVEAMGISVLGGQEDMATAQITFESGCVARLTASRVSYENARTMQIYSARSFASLDFSTGKATTVEPREDILRRQFFAPGQSPLELKQTQTNLFEDYLVRKELSAPSVNAIEEEQRDFYRAIQQKTRPRVDGEAGRDALAVAEHILKAITNHAWDGQSLGRTGPSAMPALPILRPAA